MVNSTLKEVAQICTSLDVSIGMVWYTIGLPSQRCTLEVTRQMFSAKMSLIIVICVNVMPLSRTSATEAQLTRSWNRRTGDAEGVIDLRRHRGTVT